MKLLVLCGKEISAEINQTDDALTIKRTHHALSGNVFTSPGAKLAKNLFQIRASLSGRMMKVLVGKIHNCYCHLSKCATVANTRLQFFVHKCYVACYSPRRAHEVRWVEEQTVVRRPKSCLSSWWTLTSTRRRGQQNAAVDRRRHPMHTFSTSSDEIHNKTNFRSSSFEHSFIVISFSNYLIVFILP